MPEIVCVGWLVTPPAVLIATVGATVSSVNTTGVLVPVLPAASVSLATMLWEPSPDSVTVVLHTPPAPTVAVPSGVVLPLSYSVPVAPTAASPAATVPEIVCVAWLVTPPVVLTATVGGTVSSVNTSGVLMPVLPAASVSLATMLWEPSPDSVTVVLHTPPLPTVAVPSGVVPPLSYSVTVAPTAASAAATVPEIVCVNWLVMPPVGLTETVGGTESTATAIVAHPAE